MVKALDQVSPHGGSLMYGVAIAHIFVLKDSRCVPGHFRLSSRDAKTFIVKDFQCLVKKTFSSRTDSAYILAHKGFLCGLAIAYKLVVGMCRGLFMWSGHDIYYCLSGLSLSLSLSPLYFAISFFREW